MPTYAGSGKATLLNAGGPPHYAWYQELTVQDMKSLAFQLERQKSAHYALGASVQVQFSADPGAFSVDIEGSDDDAANSYVVIGSLTAVNSAFYGRFDMVDGQLRYPLFVRLALSAITNAVTITAKITR